MTCIRDDTELPGESGGSDGILFVEFDTDSSCIAVAIVSQELTAQMTIH